MIEIRHESLANVKSELTPLLDEHWELVALNKGKIKLNPDWKEYARLDASGTLRIFTARQDGVLVGYMVLIINKSLHYSDHFFAVCDVVFVKPDSRAGATGYKLIKYVENYCKQVGCSTLTINTKVHIPFDNLMIGMAFDLIERVYCKYLGK